MSDTALVGQVLASQFRILKKLGQGGMGAVFLAEQLEMERKVVVKVLHEEVSAQNPIIIERFKREAKAVAQLNHPNIVQVFVFGHADNGQLYLAMEYIEGRDLGSELGHGVLAQPRALKILDQVCAALIEAHGAGIVHRDLKPENIMLAQRHGNPDYVKVLDFGIAKLHDAGDSKPALTQQGSVFGTPRYMSPEQVRGQTVDARSDLYALGLILYEMVCGRHPFEAVTTIDYLMKHVNEPVPVPSVEFQDLEIAPRIEALILKCLEKDPAQRYQSAAELQRDVRLALRDFSEATRGYPTSGEGALPKAPATAARPGPASTGPKKGMPAWVWALIGLVLVGGIIGLVLAIGPSSNGGKDPIALTGDDPDDRPTPHHPIDPDDDPAPDDPDEPDDPDDDPDDEPDPDDGPAPSTTVTAGASIDGFPLPDDVTSVTSSPQMEMYESAYSARDLIGFYRAKLHGRYKVEDMANGLMLKGEDTPFSYVMVQNNGDRNYLMLSRNPLAPKKADGPLPAAFGVDFPPDATLVMRSAQAVVARSRQSLASVCAFYEAKYSGRDGFMWLNNLDSSTPTCMVSATGEDSDWSGLAIMADPMSPGAVMISVAARM